MTLWSTPGVRRLAALTTLSALAACTSVPAPVQDVAEAERAVQEAAAADAEALAPAELDKARRKLEAAKSALAAQENLRARQLAEQALVDAELAEITAGAEQAARTAAELRAQIGDPGGSATQPVAAW
jgi:alanyl-tRNA synthetase